MVIPEGVTEIDGRAFAFTGRIVLTSVAIPASVRQIGDGALTCLTLPKGLQNIGVNAFYGCTRLTAVDIPAGVRSIGPWAFCKCASLTGITIPKGIRSIEQCTFWGCTSLTGVNLPESVTELGGQAFCGCGNLSSVTILGRLQAADRSVFGDCRPVLIAPNMPLSAFDKNDKPGAVLGFAKACLEQMEMDEDTRQSSLKYIRNQRKRYYSAAIRHPELFRLMLAEKMIPRKDIELLLDECDKQNSAAAKAEILEYAHRNFKPADPARKLRL